MRKIILASASPRRKELLAQMGLEYEVIVSHVEEDGFDQVLPSKLVQSLALAKARAVAKHLDQTEKGPLIIGADTIVVLDQQVLGKPKDSLDAQKMLRILSGKMHMVYTGVSLIDTKNNVEETFFESTKIYMKKMSDQEIGDYVLTKEPLDKAGSYGIQGKGGIFIDRIEGDYFTVMGLPIAKLYDHLKRFR